MRYGCTYVVKKSCYALFPIFVYLMVVLFFVQNTVGESSAVLEISVSLVEGDVFGPGDSFHVIVEIRNREAEGRIDVTVTYDVLDPDDVVLLSESKTVAVETKSSFAEGFKLPSYVSDGNYRFRANVTTLDGSKWSEASQSFSVMVFEEGEQHIIEYIMLIALIVTVGGLLFEHRRVSKMKVSGKDLNKFFEKKE